MNKFISLMAVLSIAVFSQGCDTKGRVIQGRVIAYDKSSMTVTFIEDKSLVQGQPDYSALPPVVFQTPEDRNEMGADPDAGLRMGLDTENSRIKIYDPATGQFSEIGYALTDKKDHVDKNDPLVKGKPFPLIDRNAGTVQIYSSRQKCLVTFSLPAPYAARPDNTWAAGDEIRIYYKDMGRALRMMNITKTDIFKK